jgi:RNA polymerase sigma-70 factor, ECF subfamily
VGRTTHLDGCENRDRRRPASHTQHVIGDEFARILDRAQHGDESAFTVLWRDLNPALLRYLAVAGEPADDVAAETWATVVKGLVRFTGDENAWRAWVFTIARRRAVDAGRKRERTVARDRAWEPWAAFGSHAPDPAELMIQRLDTDAALALVAQLSPLQAEVVMLRVVGGLAVEEVARVVGRSPGAVRVAHHRGLVRLRELLAARGVTHSGAAALYRTR